MAANVNVQLKKIIVRAMKYDGYGVPKQVTTGNCTSPAATETEFDTQFTDADVVELTANFEYQAEWAQDPQRTATPEYIAADAEVTITILARGLATATAAAIMAAFDGDGTQYALTAIGYGGAEVFYNVSGVARPASQGGTPYGITIECKAYGDSPADIYDFVTY
jgi:hypothetical protein